MRRLKTLSTGLVAAAVLGMVALFAPPAHADNPIVQTIYTADPAPLVYNGRVYLYTGHDEDNSTYFTMKEWRGWCSAHTVKQSRHSAAPAPAPPGPARA